jgi:hypothetical protein
MKIWLYGSFLTLALELLTETMNLVAPSKKKKKGADEAVDLFNNTILGLLKSALKQFTLYL